MNDLHVIQRQNTKAVADSIPDLRASGKWVVSSYAGLHFVHAEGFTNKADAVKYQADKETEAIPGNRYQLLEPTTTEAQLEAKEELKSSTSSEQDVANAEASSVAPQGSQVK